MSPEKQRIAIAEACGWAHASVEPFAHPDYLNDLNAMHEAEKALKKEQRETYFVKLGAILVWSDEGDGDAPMYWHHTHATAAQRAEAFLRTIGKWEDEKPVHP